MPSSSASLPDRSEGVYIIERRLHNVLCVPDRTEVASLGSVADDYLWRHGWDLSSRSFIVKMYHALPTKQQFVRMLMKHGAAGAEMEYLYDMILLSSQ